MATDNERINLPPACKIALRNPGINYKEEVHVLGWRFKRFPNKSQKNIFDQIDNRQRNGEILKQVTNQHSFHAVNITCKSFKEPDGDVHFVSKFYYIGLYLRKLKNNDKYAVLG